MYQTQRTLGCSLLFTGIVPLILPLKLGGLGASALLAAPGPEIIGAEAVTLRSMRGFDVIRSPYRSESDWSPYWLTRVGRVAPSSSSFADQGIPSWCIPAASLHGTSDVFCSTATEASCRFFLCSGLGAR